MAWVSPVPVKNVHAPCRLAARYATLKREVWFSWSSHIIGLLEITFCCSATGISSSGAAITAQVIIRRRARHQPSTMTSPAGKT